MSDVGMQMEVSGKRGEHILTGWVRSVFNNLYFVPQVNILMNNKYHR